MDYCDWNLKGLILTNGIFLFDLISDTYILVHGVLHEKNVARS